MPAAVAPDLRLLDPAALVGLAAVDPRQGPIGVVADVGLAAPRRVRYLLVRDGSGTLTQIDADRILGFEAGRVLVRSPRAA